MLGMVKIQPGWYVLFVISYLTKTTSSMPRHSASQICQCIPFELHLNLSISIFIHLSARDSQNTFFVQYTGLQISTDSLVGSWPNCLEIPVLLRGMTQAMPEIYRKVLALECHQWQQWLKVSPTMASNFNPGKNDRYQTDWKLLNLAVENLVSRVSSYYCSAANLHSVFLGCLSNKAPVYTQNSTIPHQAPKPKNLIYDGHLKLCTPCLASTHHPSRWGMQSLQEDIPGMLFPLQEALQINSHMLESFQASSLALKGQYNMGCFRCNVKPWRRWK